MANQKHKSHTHNPFDLTRLRHTINTTFWYSFLLDT